MHQMNENALWISVRRKFTIQQLNDNQIFKNDLWRRLIFWPFWDMKTSLRFYSIIIERLRFVYLESLIEESQIEFNCVVLMLYLTKKMNFKFLLSIRL